VSSSSSGDIVVDTAHGRAARAADPFHNPSYPQRTHLHERAALQVKLSKIEERLKSAHQKLSAATSHPRLAVLTRLYHQMQGASDQVAEAVRRMPLEAGGLYHEDSERLEQALAAFERTFGKWESAAI
jgi:predicted  nucleic acid-binding Zn-ribbon protein